jgi:hypothetical protein
MIKSKPIKKDRGVEKVAVKITEWVGTPLSIVVHTIIFATAFLVYFLGVSLEIVLLVMTTFLSIEAIYLSLFIQLSVNRTTESLEEVEEDLGEIQEDVEGLEGGIKRIRRNVAELESDVENISEDIDRYYLEDDKEASQEQVAHVESSKSLQNIERELIMLSKGIIALRDDLENLKKNLP